jgi:hypothetical protein
MDIAGVNSRDGRGADSDPGATGFGVRTFVELATLLAERKSPTAPTQTPVPSQA